MDPIDGFYQALDSEQVLLRHGPELRADAQEIVAQHPDARVAGLITLPDSGDADAVGKMLVASTGQEIPPGKLLVGIVPRGAVEGLLAVRCGNYDWREEPGQPQRVLPVVVSTRDGFRFGFFRLHGCDEGTNGDA